MSRSSDAWYVRLPDNRVMRANSTKSVRHNIKSGQIPPGSFARRFPFEHWRPLHRLDAFADLVQSNGEAPRDRHGEVPEKDIANELHLHHMGVRSLATELMTALESSLVKNKVKIACGAGLFSGLALQLHEILLPSVPWPGSLALTAGVGAVLLVIAAIAVVLLTRLTFIELSELRPAKDEEIRQNLRKHVVHLFLGYLLVIGTIAAFLFFLEWWFSQLNGVAETPWQHPGHTIMISIFLVVQIVLQVILLPLLGFALLLGPFVVIEELSFMQALQRWSGLVTQHLPRLFLYEALAASVALVACLPLLIPVGFAAWNVPVNGPPALVARATLALLFGLALTPAIGYLPVANVYVFLNLRYEHSSPR